MWWPRLFSSHAPIKWDDYEKDYSDLPAEVGPDLTAVLPSTRTAQHLASPPCMCCQHFLHHTMAHVSPGPWGIRLSCPASCLCTAVIDRLLCPSQSKWLVLAKCREDLMHQLVMCRCYTSTPSRRLRPTRASSRRLLGSIVSALPGPSFSPPLQHCPLSPAALV